MRFTNKLNLPQAVVDAIIAANEEYSRGDSTISISELLTPPRIIALRRRHKDEIVEDVADLVFSLIGTSIHDKLEAANSIGISEKRLFTEVLGWRISGKFDHFNLEKGRLTDYKMVTGWKVRNGEPDPDFEKQLNLYAELLDRSSYSVSSLCNVCFIRDWSKRQAAREPSFPQQQVVEIEVPLWPKEKRVAFLEERVRLHQAAQSSEVPPLCTEEERWAKPPKYAVTKAGRKRAIKLCDSRAEAYMWIQGQTDSRNMIVEVRPAENIRCEHYCNVARFCDFGKSLTPTSSTEELSL